MAALVSLLAIAGGSLGCSGDEPRPVPVAEPSAAPRFGAIGSRGASPGPAGASAHEAHEAPDADGISDLARISRYVFAEMRARASTCSREPLPPGRFDYTYEVTVRGGRVTRGRLVQVSAATAEGVVTLERSKWPAALETSLNCNLPFLQAMPMKPSPADGVYETLFSGVGPPGR
jgi:hypothetical protein